MQRCNGVIVGLMMLLSACSSTPYRENFACVLQDDYGKCIDVPGAYREAVNGVDSGAPKLSKDGRPVEPLQSAAPGLSQANASASDSQGINAASGNPDQYGAYRAALYQQLRAMLAGPTTPMIRAPQTLRTLILSYEKRDDPSRLYMPRYVFSMVEGPSFVLGQYLDRSADGLPDSIVDVSQDELSKDRH